MHAVSGAISLPSRGAFHLSLAVLCTIGHPLVFSLGGWSPRFRTGFHVSRPTQDTAGSESRSLQACHLLWGGFPSRFALRIECLARSYNPGLLRFGLVPVRSPLLRESRLISFPPGTEMFQFPGLASSGLCIQPVDTLARGFPHSESRWSKTLCVSHRTFGAWPVLLRRRMPRHPPRALSCIISIFQRFSSVLPHEQLESTLLGASSHSRLIA